MPLGYPLTFSYQNNRMSQFLGFNRSWDISAKFSIH